jgi:hypothetical protein
MGFCATPKELRASLPLPPNTSWRSSDAPFATKCCSVKLGAEIHQTKHLDDALQLFQTLQFVVKSCQQINRSTASCQLSFFGGEVNAQFPAQGFSWRFAMCPEQNSRFPVRTLGTTAATAASPTGKVICNSFVRGHRASSLFFPPTPATPVRAKPSGLKGLSYKRPSSGEIDGGSIASANQHAHTLAVSGTINPAR